MRKIFVDELIRIRENNDKTLLLTGDLGFGFFENFAQRFPNSFINAGVAEQNMVSVAAGLSSQEFLPFIYSINNFASFRCLEQIRDDLCYHNLNTVIVSAGPGYSYGSLGYTHYGIEDISVTRCLPNITIFSPSDPIELKYIMNNIHDINGPIYLRLGRNSDSVGDDIADNAEINAPRLIQKGEHVALFVSGEILQNVMELLSQLKDSLSFSPTILSFHCLKPFMQNFPLPIDGNHTYVLSVEEHVYAGGFSSLILENFHQAISDAKMQFIPISACTDKLGIVGDRNFMISKILKKVENALFDINRQTKL